MFFHELRNIFLKIIRKNLYSVLHYNCHCLHCICFHMQSQISCCAFFAITKSAHWNLFIYSTNSMKYFAILYYEVTFFALKLCRQGYLVPCKVKKVS